jgi:hypothetical protein
VAMIVLGLIAALPTVGLYMPMSLGTVAMDLCLDRDPGNFLGPVLFNVALVPALFGVTWLAFRRQEL